MSLSRQLVLLISTLVLLLFVGTFLISVHNTRDYLENQLASHAQDAATSLGLSATAHVASGDQAMFTSMVNAMAHRGDYLSIRLEGLDGRVLVERHTDFRADVPRWFMALFPLHPPEGEAVMMSGWRQVGKVRVVSHPGLAYRKLWSTVVDTLVWFCAAAGALLLLALILLRWLLRPLKKVEGQAEAICNREFPIVEERPFTLEFRRVVDAMNRLSGKVRQMLDDAERLATRLREQAYTDALTGLANRRHFRALLESRLADEQSAGGLLLVQIRDFTAFNDTHGYQAGDQLLIAVAELLRQETAGLARTTLAHVAGADFAVLCEGMDMARLRELAARIAAALGGLCAVQEGLSADVGQVGGVMYRDQEAGELLAQADLALRQARQAGGNAWVVLEPAHAACVTRSASQWGETIERALDKGSFQMQAQGVYAADGTLLHRELFLQLVDREDDAGVIIPAGVFVPVAESLGLAVRIDHWVITEVCERLSGLFDGETLAVNLSSGSLVEAECLDWVEQTLRAHPEVARRLVLEWSEYTAQAHPQRLREWIDRLAPLGVEFSLDHFGKGFSAFTALRELKVHYLKVDAAFTRDLEQDPQDTFFLHVVIDIAHGLELRVIAEAVESAAVWESLRETGIDGGRGYFLGRPEDVRA